MPCFFRQLLNEKLYTINNINMIAIDSENNSLAIERWKKETAPKPNITDPRITHIFDSNPFR